MRIRKDLPSAPRPPPSVLGIPSSAAIIIPRKVLLCLLVHCVLCIAVISGHPLHTLLDTVVTSVGIPSNSTAPSSTTTTPSGLSTVNGDASSATDRHHDKEQVVEPTERTHSINRVFEEARGRKRVAGRPRPSGQRRKVSVLGLFELSTRTGERPEGLSELAAAELAIKHINEGSLLPGYTLELLTNDTQVSGGSPRES